MTRAERLTSREKAEERRQAELARGAQIVATKFLEQCFDPGYVPEGRINAEERRRRDEYRNRLSQTNGGQNK